MHASQGRRRLRAAGDETNPAARLRAGSGGPQLERSASMTKSELIEALAARQVHLAANDVELAVKSLLEQMSQALADGDRIEIRGFGSFSLHYRPPRMGRNPKTGDAVALPGKHVPHFKPGKELRERVNESAKPLLPQGD
nr:integration host factor subunit beta [Dokdonella koreensis]